MLKEPFPAEMDKYMLTMLQFPFWLQKCLINGISWNDTSWMGHSGQQTFVKCAEATWNYKVRKA